MENQVNNTTVDTVESTATETEATTVTMTKDEFDKKIQGEGDRIRTEYSKRVKELEAKIKELTPAEKSEAEIDFENRLAALEAKEKRMALLDSLSANGISKDFADYFKDGADIETFSKIYKSAVEAEITKRIKSDGYVPREHKAGNSMTKDDFNKLSMEQKERLYIDNPELYRTLVGR